MPLARTVAISALLAGPLSSCQATLRLCMMKDAPAPLDPAIEQTLSAFRQGLQACLGQNLIAIYIAGSLLTGDFEPASSDLDFLVVTREPLGSREASDLAELHRKLAATNSWGDRLEGGYAAQSRLRPWGIESFIAAIEPGAELRAETPSDYTADNMVALRERSLALYGPPPEQIMPAVDRATLDTALREYLAELVAAPAATEPSPEQIASWVLNVARCLFGLEAGRPCTKSEAAAWLAARQPDLAAVLTTALAVRRGAPAPAALDTLRAGFAALVQDAPADERPGGA